MHNPFRGKIGKMNKLLEMQIIRRGSAQIQKPKGFSTKIVVSKQSVGKEAKQKNSYVSK